VFTLLCLPTRSRPLRSKAPAATDVRVCRRLWIALTQARSQSPRHQWFRSLAIIDVLVSALLWRCAHFESHPTS